MIAYILLAVIFFTIDMDLGPLQYFEYFGWLSIAMVVYEAVKSLIKGITIFDNDSWR